MSIVQSKNYLLEFSDKGRPVSFKYLPLKKELLDLNKVSPGFYMLVDGNKVIPFTGIEITPDNKLIARNYNPGVGIKYKKNLN